MKKCNKCREFKENALFVLNSKEFTTCAKCTIERRERAAEERRARYAEGKVCPQCKELKFEYRVSIGEKSARLSRQCVDCLIVVDRKRWEERERYLDFTYRGYKGW